MRSTSSFIFLTFALLLTGAAAQAQIIFDRPKTEPPLDNPYTLNVPRAEVIKGLREVLQTCATQINQQSSKPEDGQFVTQPVVFSKGVNTRTDIEHVATLLASDVHNWLRGRYYLEIRALPLDEKRSQLTIVAHIQGQLADVTGAKWVDLQSNGMLEDEALRGLASKVLGVEMGLKKGAPRRLMSCEY